MGAIAKRESPTKEFVSVLCVCWAADGRIEPLRFLRDNGDVVKIDRVLDVRRAASLRAGGQGMRYTCRVTNEETGLVSEMPVFHDGDYWFIEKPDDRTEASVVQYGTGC